MKVLLFTHRNDIDGMGSAVLAKLAFADVDYVLCESSDLKFQVEKFIQDKLIYTYDFIFITDIPPEEDLLKEIAKDKKLAPKVLIFDHHLSSSLNIKAKYAFLTVKISNEKGLCSGTSLFYDYLKETNYFKEGNQVIHEFSELTRKYDTWEWKTIYHDEMPRDLTLLFDSLENDTYINLMYEKLKKNPLKFKFSKFETLLIQNRKQLTKEKITYYLQHLYYEKVKGYQVAIAFINYEFRNDLADYLRDNNYPIDLVILVSLDNNTISYRTIKDNISANSFAQNFNGGGHDKAAGTSITKDTINKIIKILFLDES